MRSCGASEIAMQWLHQRGIGPALWKTPWSDLITSIMGVDGACGKCAYATITKLPNYPTTTKRKTPKCNKHQHHQQAGNKPLPTATPSNHQAIKQVTSSNRQTTIKLTPNRHQTSTEPTPRITGSPKIQGTSGKGSQIQGWDRAKLRCSLSSPAAFIWWHPHGPVCRQNGPKAGPNINTTKVLSGHKAGQDRPWIPPNWPRNQQPPNMASKSSTAKYPQIPHHRVTCRSRRVDTFFRKMSRLSQIHTQRADPSSSTEIQGVFELQQL